MHAIVRGLTALDNIFMSSPASEAVLFGLMRGR